MPLFTVVLSRVIFGETQTTKVYCSLLPIIIGVGIATITELSFDVIGLGAALSSTCSSSLQNIFSKKVLSDTGIHPLRLVHLLGRLAVMMFLPIWLLCDGYNMFYDAHLVTRRSLGGTLVLLVSDGFLNWMQNFVAFTVLNKVAPLTYAVANATKRVTVVLVSLIIMQNPVTPFNVLGMMVAILGVLAYNKAKYDSNRALKKSSFLPVANGTVPTPYHQLHPAYPFDHSREMLVHSAAPREKGPPQPNGVLMAEKPVTPGHFVGNAGFDLLEDSGQHNTNFDVIVHGGVSKRVGAQFAGDPSRTPPHFKRTRTLSSSYSPSSSANHSGKLSYAAS